MHTATKPQTDSVTDQGGIMSCGEEVVKGWTDGRTFYLYKRVIEVEAHGQLAWPDVNERRWMTAQWTE